MIVVAPSIGTTSARPTTKTCGVCGHVDPLPPGVNPSTILCPNREAMWHATYNELLIRLGTASASMEATIASLQRDVAGIDNARKAAILEATRIQELLGD